MGNTAIEKLSSGIAGLDEVTHGGFPKGRPVLVCGSPGSGKTLLAMQFLNEGAQHGEPGVFVSFEENIEDLRQNVRSVGIDLAPLEQAQQIRLLRVDLDGAAVMDVGQWNLDPIFLRLGAACDAIGATRLAIDGIDALFGVLQDRESLRYEFTRLLRWLRERGLSVIVTAERGSVALTRHGLEEYLTDCVLTLEHRVESQVASRQLRVVKYRGSAHGGNEYPFLIGEHGLSVFPITSVGLRHPVSRERVPTGIAGLDAMFEGGGVHRGSTLLVTGSSGTGKSSIAACFARSASLRGERVSYFALEESPDQIARNMASIGVDLVAPQAEGLLRIDAFRPSSAGLEGHLVDFLHHIEGFRPAHVIIDPISAFAKSGVEGSVHVMLIRLIDSLKAQGITTVISALTERDDHLESSAIGISSLVDTWISLRNLEIAGERTRALYILKSRGTKHSNQIREFQLGAEGIRLLGVELDDGGNVMTGSQRELASLGARLALDTQQETASRRRALLDRKRSAMDTRILAMKAELEDEIETMESLLRQEERQIDVEQQRRGLLSSKREHLG